MMSDHPEVTVRKIDLAWEIAQLAVGSMGGQESQREHRKKLMLDAFRDIYPHISNTIDGDITKPSE